MKILTKYSPQHYDGERTRKIYNDTSRITNNSVNENEKFYEILYKGGNSGYKNSREWYDRVYLCYEETNPPRTRDLKINEIIIGFNCYKYKSFKNADDGPNRIPYARY